jgi:hypothetical protein
MKTKLLSRVYQVLMAVLCIVFLSQVVGYSLSVSMVYFAAPLLMILVLQIAVSPFAPRVRGLSLMAITAYDDCGAEVADGDHTPAADCIEEGSGIVGFLAVKKGFDLNSILDQGDYDDAKTAGNLVVIADVEAYWPSAQPQKIPGLRGRTDRLGHIMYELGFKHEGVDANLEFWNKLNKSRNYGVVFITEEFKAFAPLTKELNPVLCSYFAAPGSDQEFGKTRFFQGTITWKHKDLPYLANTLTSTIIQSDFE